VQNDGNGLGYVGFQFIQIAWVIAVSTVFSVDSNIKYGCDKSGECVVQKSLRNDSISEQQGQLCDMSRCPVGTVLNELHVQ
jgi:hypothetical protein